MDPLTQALVVFGKLVDLRILYLQSLSEAKRTELADKSAEGELAWLNGWIDLLKLLAPKA
jgi:hypothetical protein